MDRHTRKCRDNWVITVESKNEQHSLIIQAAVAKRAYQLFEQRGRAHGFDLDDWITAEREFLVDDFDGNSSQFHFFIECPRDPEVTTILSITTHSMVVFGAGLAMSDRSTMAEMWCLSIFYWRKLIQLRQM